MEQPCRVLLSDGLQLRSNLCLHHAIVVEDKGGKPVVRQVYPRRIECAADLAIQASARLLEENSRGIVLRRRKREMPVGGDPFQFLPCVTMGAREVLGGLPHLTIRSACEGEIRERNRRDVPLGIQRVERSLAQRSAASRLGWQAGREAHGADPQTESDGYFHVASYARD